MDTLMTGKDFIARLDELLNERCMSDSDIHKKVKLSSGTISKMRSNGSDPTFRTIQLVCIALDISLSDFFNINKKPKNGDYFNEYELRLVSLSRDVSPEAQGRLMTYAEGLAGVLPEK